MPFVRKSGGKLELVEHAEGQALGRITAFNGQMGMYVRALTYMLSHGGDGLAQAAKDAVLNANYIKARLQHVFSVPFPDYPCMHEALFDDHFLEGTGVTTLDFAKALIDEGFHPMTMYFPLVVHGAMLVEPTESESKQTLDHFCDVDARPRGRRQGRQQGPLHLRPDERAPRRRLDETRAARPRSSNGNARSTSPSRGVAALPILSRKRGGDQRSWWRGAGVSGHRRAPLHRLTRPPPRCAERIADCNIGQYY